MSENSLHSSTYQSVNFIRTYDQEIQQYVSKVCFNSLFTSFVLVPTLWKNFLLLDRWKVKNVEDVADTMGRCHSPNHWLNLAQRSAYRQRPQELERYYMWENLTWRWRSSGVRNTIWREDVYSCYFFILEFLTSYCFVLSWPDLLWYPSSTQLILYFNLCFGYVMVAAYLRSSCSPDIFIFLTHKTFIGNARKEI